MDVSQDSGRAGGPMSVSRLQTAKASARRGSSAGRRSAPHRAAAPGASPGPQSRPPAGREEKKGSPGEGEMRTRILEAASALMTDRGVEATSLKDIARAASISTGTLYYYYSAKDDIVFDLAEANISQITEGILSGIERAQPGRTPRQVLGEVFERVLAAETRDRLHLYLLSSAAAAGTPLAERYRRQYARWRRTLEYGLNRILPRDNRVLADLSLALLDGLIIQQTLGTEGPSPDELLDFLLRDAG